ncbi:MAG: cell wall-binding repeat-containing protein [Clostridium sp.]|nr:cell wall-binding repeat-containing protein [Clostridium sp.]
MDYKKSVSVGLALSMFLSSSAAALTPDEALKKVEKLGINTLEAQISCEDDLKNLKDTDIVRIIVELESDSVIDKLTAANTNISEMSIEDVTEIKESVLKEQDNVKNNIKTEGIEDNIINSFTTVTNGFSMETTLENAKTLENIDGIKSVTIANEYERPEPLMNHSGEITETEKAWTNGFNGEGTIISIIDSGIDSSHKDLVLSDPSKAELNKSKVEETIKKEELKGKFYTDKIPYGYNYMDGDFEIRDITPKADMHGMHVAGISGANGDEKNGGIKGTAPESQLLAMKVFGNNPEISTTYGDIVVKAIDDSVLLGADVINMSLGSTSAFVDDNDPEQMAVNRAVEHGVLVSISAGNSNVFGSGIKNPYVSNPDYGVGGAPGVSTKSLQVASVENNMATGMCFEYNSNSQLIKVPYMTAGTDILTVLKNKDLQVVECGLGKPEDFKTSVSGKVALIQRGALSFTEKINNATAKGAIAVIIYNNAANGDGMFGMSVEDIKIPAIAIGHSQGLGLLTALKNEPNTTIAVKGNSASGVNPGKNSMSDFTSWGFTPNFDFKPEITGVGGQVWSLANDNKYQNMSGTSMAAPNVSGGSALVLQRVDKLFNLTGEARVTMAKNILMSTATPHVDNGHLKVGNYQNKGVVAGNNYTSPRRQGAGIMNLAGATTTNAIVTESKTGLCKVNLKEIVNDKATFNIKVENFGDTELTYDVAGTVQTDFVDKTQTYLQAQNIIDKDTNKFPITFSKDKLTVAAKENGELTVTVDLSNAITAYNKASMKDTFVNGGYVEGFVTLTDSKDNNPQLSIPYVGFNGQWDKAPTIDASIYDKTNKSFYDSTAMMTPDTEKEGNLFYLGLPYGSESLSKANCDLIDFSPNGDGNSDSIFPMLSYLRNIKQMEVEILDKNGKVLRTLAKKEDLRKHYHDGKYPTKTFLEDAAWDGTVNNEVVADGTYIYRIKTKIDFKDAKWQNYDFKVNVDNTAPIIKDVVLNSNEVTVTASDNLDSHIYSYSLLTPLTDKNGEKVIYTNSTGKFDATDLLAAGYTEKDCIVAVRDYAKNITIKDCSEPLAGLKDDKTAPITKIKSPGFGAVVNSNEVVFEGTVEDASKIDEVTIDGEKVDLKYSSDKKMWTFAHKVTLENGFHSLYVNSKDVNGNEVGYSQKIYVDATAPELIIENVTPITTKDSIEIKGTASDNFPNLKIVVNGDVKENSQKDISYVENIAPVSKDFSYNVNLKDGKNEIIIEVTDEGGNKTTKSVTVEKVNKLNVEVNKIAGINRYATAVEVSKKGFEKSNYAVLANGYAFADALVSGPLASEYNAPVLLTDKDSIPEDTKSELKRLQTQTVFAIGGTAVISESVINELQTMNIQVVRLAGENRYETSLEVAKYLEKVSSNNIYFVNGYADPDAVSISSIAAIEKNPIILTEKDVISPEITNWLVHKKNFNGYFIGGTSVISDNLLNKIDSISTSDLSVNRIGGANRYETNAIIIDKFYGSSLENVLVTESTKLVDALVVAPYASKYSAPIVITESQLDKTQENALSSRLSEKVEQIGGQVSSDVIKSIVNLLSK